MMVRHSQDTKNPLLASGRAPKTSYGLEGKWVNPEMKMMTFDSILVLSEPKFSWDDFRVSPGLPGCL